MKISRRKLSRKVPQCEQSPHVVIPLSTYEKLLRRSVNLCDGIRGWEMTKGLAYLKAAALVAEEWQNWFGNSRCDYNEDTLKAIDEVTFFLEDARENLETLILQSDKNAREIHRLLGLFKDKVCDRARGCDT